MERKQRGSKAKGSSRDATRRSNPKKGAATQARPSRVTAFETRATKLKHSVEVEVSAIHHPTLHLKADPPSADHNFATDEDPFFYEAETEVRVSIDGQEIASFVNFQGASDLVELDYALTVRYLDERLPSVLLQTVVSLYEEWRDFSPKTPEVREALIARIRNQAENAARSRLPRIERRPVSDEEFFDFMEKVRDAIEQIPSKGRTKVRGLKTAVAKILFPQNDNPLQELERQCERRRINFIDLLFNLGRPDLAQEIYESRKPTVKKSRSERM